MRALIDEIEPSRESFENGGGDCSAKTLQIPRDRNAVEIIKPEPAFLEKVAQGLSGELVGVLDPVEALFFENDDRPSIVYNSNTAVVRVEYDAENTQEFPPMP
jgi:hypothetical protein